MKNAKWILVAGAAGLVVGGLIVFLVLVRPLSSSAAADRANDRLLAVRYAAVAADLERVKRENGTLADAVNRAESRNKELAGYHRAARAAGVRLETELRGIVGTAQTGGELAGRLEQGSEGDLRLAGEIARGLQHALILARQLQLRGGGPDQ